MTHVPPNEWLISVDDHVIEPPRVWLDRLPKKYHDRAPRMAKGDLGGAVWQYEDTIVPTAGLSVAAGKEKDEFSPEPVSFDNMRPGAYDPFERVKDMDRGRGPRLALLSIFPALLRPDFLGGRRQGSGAAVHSGLQRLDDRGMVRLCPRSVHPAYHHPALGSCPCCIRDGTLRSNGGNGLRVFRKSGAPRPPHDP